MPHHIGPEPLVLHAIFRDHPGPGIVAHGQVGERHGKAGEPRPVGDRVACAIPADRRLDLASPGIDDPPPRGALPRLTRLADHAGLAPQRADGGPADGGGAARLGIKRAHERVPVRVRREARGGQGSGGRM